MENNKFDVWIKNLQEFSDEDKDKCRGISCDIIEIALCVRKNGILIAQERLPQLTGDMFLQNTVSSILSSTALPFAKTQEITEKIQGEIMEGDYKGAELLKRILVIEGAISIYQGNNPMATSNYLNKFFGENYLHLNHK